MLSLPGLNVAEIAKKELMKVDLNHNGVPDAIEALEAAEHGLEALEEFTAGITPTEALAALSAFNKFREPANQMSPAEMQVLAGKLVAIPAGLKAAEAVLKSAEAALKTK